MAWLISQHTKEKIRPNSMSLSTEVCWYNLKANDGQCEASAGKGAAKPKVHTEKRTDYPNLLPSFQCMRYVQNKNRHNKN